MAHTAVEQEVKALNKLLRGELSAIETYQMVIDKLAGDPSLDKLRALQDEHRKSAEELRSHLKTHDAATSDSSGAWGDFVKALEGAATHLGRMATLLILRQGEETGLEAYEGALYSLDLNADCRPMLTELSSRQREHLHTFDSILQEAPVHHDTDTTARLPE
jgi:hypothetical protein